MEHRAQASSDFLKRLFIFAKRLRKFELLAQAAVFAAMLINAPHDQRLYLRARQQELEVVNDGLGALAMTNE